MTRRPLTLAVSSLLAGLTAAACSSSNPDSDPSAHAGSGGIAGAASSSSGAGGLVGNSGSAGAAGVGGNASHGGAPGSGGTNGIGGVSGVAGTDASAAGSAGQDRWLDPGEGTGCATINGSACGSVPTWGCAVPSPTNPACQPVSAGSSNYCCGSATCIRDWAEDETFCPGPPIMINCVEGAVVPARCSPYGTSNTTRCCDP